MKNGFVNSGRKKHLLHNLEKEIAQVELQEDGSFRLPEIVQSTMGLHEGDYVLFRYDSDGILMQKLQAEVAPGDYPKKRYLDEAFICVTRFGKKVMVSFSDLTVDEQMKHLTGQNREQVEGLCLYLAETIRSLGSLHHLNHSLKYKNHLSPMMYELTELLKHTVGDDLRGIILYGSYARGDYDNESNINFLVLIDDNVDNETIHQFRKDISEGISDLDLRYDLVISLKFMSYDYFEKYKRINLLIKQIDEESIDVNDLLRRQDEEE